MSKKVTALLMWFIPLSFFTHQFILRLWPGLIIHQIIDKFSINASSFGILISSYYYGYAIAQIFLAILINKFGIKKVFSICAVVCGVSFYLFDATNNWYCAIISRFFVGIGSSVAFLGVSKSISEWFKPESYSRMIGFSFSIGYIGAVYGGKPLNSLLEKFGTANISLALASISIFISIISIFFLKESQPNNDSSEDNSPLNLQDFKAIFTSKNILLLAISNLLMIGFAKGFADIWGINYLMTSFHLTKNQAADCISFVFIGMILGGPTLSYLAKIISNFTAVSLCGLIMIICITCLTYVNNLSIYQLKTILCIIGIASSYQILIFALGKDLSSRKYLNVVSAMLNAFNMIGGSFFHSIIGVIMDLFKHENVSIVDNVRSYNISLTFISICCLVGSLIVINVKRKSGKLNNYKK